MRHSCVLVATLLLHTFATPAAATTITVTSASTGSNVMNGCALRDAIQAVNALAPVGQCPAGTNGVNTINITVDTLSFTEIDAHSTGAALPALAAGRYLNLYGRPQLRTSLSVGSPCDSFVTFSSRLLEVNAGAALYVADIDFSHGCPNTLGGVGGAIANFGTLYLVRSRLYQNYAYATGLFSSTYYPGAAVYNGPDAQFSASGAVFDSNTGDGALYVDEDPQTGFASVDGCTFVDNTGSAIDNHGATQVTNSTFAGNFGLGSGAFSLTLAGGAILNNGFLGLSFATLFGNSLQGNAGFFSTELDLGATSTTWITSTLFATPVSQFSVNCSVANGASVAWLGTSISRDATCGGGSNLINTDPRLDTALGSNGGPTQTMKLLADSPAWHRAGDCLDAYGDPVSVDQRGFSRPPNHCDAGAFGDTVFYDGLQ